MVSVGCCVPAAIAILFHHSVNSRILYPILIEPSPLSHAGLHSHCGYSKGVHSSHPVLILTSVDSRTPTDTHTEHS